MEKLSFNQSETQNITLSEPHKLFKLSWQKKKMLWLQIMKIFFTVYFYCFLAFM